MENAQTRPFDPIELSKITEGMVIEGDKRKYNLFRLKPFYSQIATARGIGCNLRCGFCWINPSRDIPEGYGSFYSPQHVYDNLIKISSNQFNRVALSEATRISGCEPTLGKNHLRSLIEICKREKEFKLFLLETNGILLGYDESLVKELENFRDYLIIRLSYKAGTKETFELKTGARAEFSELPFIALNFLQRTRITYRIAAMSSDPAITPSTEKRDLLIKLSQQGVSPREIEEEQTDLFGTTKRRLVEIGIDPGKVRKEAYQTVDLREGQRIALQLGVSASPSELLKRILFQTGETRHIKCTKRRSWCGNAEDDLDGILR